MNRNSLSFQVTATLGDHADDYDIDGIVDALIASHDTDLSSIDDIESGTYWAIVEQHDTTTNAPEDETTLTAWLTLEAGCLIHGDQAELGILDTSATGDVREPLAPVSLPVPISEARGDHDKAIRAAEGRLAELGWDTAGAWEAVDTGYTINVRRSASA